MKIWHKRKWQPKYKFIETFNSIFNASKWFFVVWAAKKKREKYRQKCDQNISYLCVEAKSGDKEHFVTHTKTAESCVVTTTTSKSKPN